VVVIMASSQPLPRPRSDAHARTRRVLDRAGKRALAHGDLVATTKVHDSYAALRERTGPWSRVSIKAVLEAREG
jgi:hypothetical protein